MYVYIYICIYIHILRHIYLNKKHHRLSDFVHHGTGRSKEPWNACDKLIWRVGGGHLREPFKQWLLSPLLVDHREVCMVIQPKIVGDYQINYRRNIVGIS